MKKTIISLLMAVCLLTCLGVTAFAESTELTGSQVTFDGTKLNSTYNVADATNMLGTLQPGDDTTITITVKNDYEETTEWWMYNDIIESFETSGAISGGAYTYVLTFSGPSGSQTIYTSETVGGDTEATGMKEATNTLDEYFFLDTLKKGQTGTVTLKILLDGETQGNVYQEQAAKLDMRFAVELTPQVQPVPTGDNTDILPYVVAAAASGLLLLVVAMLRVNKARKQRGGQAE